MNAPFKSALLACSNFWDSPIQVGDQQFARFLAASGCQVAFVSTPISPLHLLRERTVDFDLRRRNHRNGGQWDLEGRIWHYVPGALVVPHNRAPLDRTWLYENWYRFTVPSLLKTITANRRSFDLIYLRDPKFRFLLDHIPHKVSMFRIADKDSGFHSHNAAMEAVEKKLARQVNLVAYTAMSLATHVESLRPRAAMYLPNSVNFEFFSASVPPPPEYSSIPRPRAVYVGSMDEWFDFSLIDYLTQQMPHVSFILIGPSEKAQSRLSQRSNLHLLGRRQHIQVPSYLQHAEVGLIPFDRSGNPELVDHINPIKLYEYMASGLPVVATQWEEIRNLATPAFLSTCREGFLANLRQVLQRPPDRDKLKQFARENDLTSRLQGLMDRLAMFAEAKR